MNSNSKPITWLLFFMSPLFSMSQDIQSLRPQTDQQKVTKSRLSREFARVSTGNTFSAIGNYAAISTKDETLKASMFFLLNNGNVLNVEVSGGAIQGAATIFDDGELNTSASIGASYNLLLHKANNALAINSTAEDVILLEIENENRKYQKKLLGLLSNKYEKDIDKDIIDARQAKTDIQSKIQTEATNIQTLKKNRARQPDIDEAENRKNAFEDFEKEIDQLINDLISKKKTVDIKKSNELLMAINTEYDAKMAVLKEKIKQMKPDAVSFSWLSFGYTAKNNSFKLFDPFLDLEKQISTEDYTTQSILISYNHMSNARALVRSGGEITSFADKKREFISIGAKFDYTDNLKSLEQVEIRDTEVIDSDNGRTKIKKQNAFSGLYEKDLDNLTAFVDYYNFIANDNIVAIHLSPLMLFRENVKPVASFQFGILLPFKDKSKQTTTVNLELFYKLNDIFNTTDNKNALLNRNSIGIQASFPFNF